MEGTALLAGDAVLHYRIIERIGAGGMGVVYKALDTRLDRAIAIKTLPSMDPKRRNQFLWEARAAASLRHPSIVVVHDFVSQPDRELIVMEFIPGEPLSERLASGPLPVKDALRCAIEIASALEAAHEAGIVHRDLKPSNILITPEGSVKLVDFGLARLQEQDADPNAIRAVAGTWGYMSPEQARGERPSPRSDIFSFGAVLYEMTTGKRAFPGKSAASVLAAVLRDDPPGTASFVPGLPPPLDHIICRCLRKDPKHRFQHMGDIRLALEDALAAARQPPRRFPALLRSLRYVAPAASLLLGGWLAWHRSPDTPANPMPVPLTTFGNGIAADASWSPDGRQVAFTWDGANPRTPNVFLTEPGASQARRLTSEPGVDRQPAWSPDGRWIAYTHCGPDGSYSLDLISPLGGSPRTLLSSRNLLGSPNWSPDGRSLIVAAHPDKNRPQVLWGVSIDSGSHRQLTWPPEGIPGDLAPAISSDGKLLAFTRKTFWRTAELYLLDLKPGLVPAAPPHRVTSFGYVGRSAWDPDGKRILFEAHRDGSGIWQIDRDGSHPRPVPGVPDFALAPALARRPDGHTSLAFMHEFYRFSIERAALGRDPLEPVEWAPSTRSQTDPSYSPDGQHVAFCSARTGYPEVWVANSDGTQASQLTYLRDQTTLLPDWSPSGDAIAFISGDRGQRQVYFLNYPGGSAISLTHEEGVDIVTGWSRDGGAMYYTTVLSGRYQVRKILRSGGSSETISTDALNGFESARGTLYYFRQPSGGPPQFIRRTARGEEIVPLVPPAEPRCVTISRPEGVYYEAAGSSDIYLFDESTGRSTRVVKNLKNPFSQSLSRFAISPDHRWLVYAPGVPLTAELMLMETLH